MIIHRSWLLIGPVYDLDKVLGYGYDLDMVLGYGYDLDMVLGYGYDLDMVLGYQCCGAGAGGAEIIWDLEPEPEPKLNL